MNEVRIEARRMRARLVCPVGFRSVSREARITATGDVAWTLVCAAMVFFMQAGFALVESGCCRFHSTQSQARGLGNEDGRR
jgi:hypothetical protein